MVSHGLLEHTCPLTDRYTHINENKSKSLVTDCLPSKRKVLYSALKKIKLKVFSFLEV